MKFANRLPYICFFVLLLFLISNCAIAVTMLTNPLNTESVPELIGKIIRAILGLTGSGALIVFIYGGILWMTSAGSSEQVKKGKDAMIWAVIGLAVIFASYAILSFVIDALTATTATAVPTAPAAPATPVAPEAP